ncbi:MAG: dTDP-4-dehydrorhamnose 3,5-epimerase [Actinomycetota bacterium]|nr:dTDP-4-dehydrorhamnose 3,5-epimerase [Actinomycetota bacterium]
MRVEESAIIPGLRRIVPDVFRDERGLFVEVHNADDYTFARDDGTELAFVEDDLSVSRQGVLRGLHGDERTWKLVQCVQGALHLVVADLRRGSEAYLRSEAFELAAADPVQLLVPAGCATGLLALEDPSALLYKQSERYRGSAGQFTVRWDDPALGIEWPVERPLLSERDAQAPDLVA